MSASEMPRDLIVLRLRSRSWGALELGALEVSKGTFDCCKYLFVVPFAWMFIWCKECWLLSLEGWEAYLRGLKVFRLPTYLTWMFWVWRFSNFKNMWLECFECWGVYLRGLEVFKVQKHMTWAFWVFKGLFWEVWRCLEFKNIWLERFEYLRAYLRGLEVWKFQQHITWMFCMFKDLFVRVECLKAYMKAFKIFWVEEMLLECLECGKA